MIDKQKMLTLGDQLGIVVVRARATTS